MALTILYAEDHRTVAQMVKDTLEFEGWRVVVCHDGAAALGMVASDDCYGLMVFDNHLPNVNGLELVRYARRLPHRQWTPIIVLSAGGAAAEALEAGADAFLNKPRDMGRLVETIRGFTYR